MRRTRTVDRGADRMAEAKERLGIDRRSRCWQSPRERKGHMRLVDDEAVELDHLERDGERIEGVRKWGCCAVASARARIALGRGRRLALSGRSWPLSFKIVAVVVRGPPFVW